MITQAAVLRELERPLDVTEIRVPALQPGHVQVDLAYSGVCHTQLMEARGRKGPDRFLPHTMGHEGSGIVRAVGSAVTKVKPGDRVVLTWIKGSGCDVPSMHYHDGNAIVNAGAVGTFLRTALVAENRVVPIPREMPLREAALLGCAIPTGAGIALNTVRMRPSESVVVFGVGGIGMSAILGAVLAHAHPIVAVDIRANKLAWAKELGATHTIDASRPDFMAALKALAGPAGFDYAIEAAGRVESMENAIAVIRPGGGTAVLAGNLAAGKRVPLDPQDLNRGKRVLGTWGGETVPDRDIPMYARLYLEGMLPLEKLISHSYSLPEINAALDDLEGGRVARALLEIAPALS